MSIIGKIEKALHVLTASGRGWRYALLKHRVAAGVEHTAVLRNLGEICTVADIGANRGQFALTARHVFPNARILSFEPLPGPAAKYRKIFANGKNVTLHQVAIGAQRGTVSIHISKRDDSSSLLPITDLQNQVFPGTNESGTETVQVAPLSDFISPVDIESPALLKLDVQGYELEALKGCEDLLDRFAYVYVECSFMELYKGQALANEVIAWLRERSFHLSGVYNIVYARRSRRERETYPDLLEKGQAIQADFLFQRTDISKDGVSAGPCAYRGEKRH